MHAEIAKLMNTEHALDSEQLNKLKELLSKPRDWFFAVVSRGTKFLDTEGNVEAISMGLSISDDASDLAPGSRKGLFVSLSVAPVATDSKIGFVPGCAGILTGTVDLSTDPEQLRDDGKPWLRLRKESGSKIVITKKGSTALGADDFEFAE